MVDGKLTVRLAESGDADTVKGIVSRTFNVEGMELDWRDLYPYWIICHAGETPVGVIQVCPGRPVGRLEFLCVVDGLPVPTRAKAMKLLWETGLATLEQGGSQLVSMLNPHPRKSVKRWLKKRGAVVMDTGNIMLRRIV